MALTDQIVIPALTDSLDPWSEDFWTKRMELVAAMEDLDAGRPSRYVNYWLRRMKSDDRYQANVMADCWHKIIDGIQADGYCPNYVDNSRADTGPIRISIHNQGRLHCYDGNHRAAVMGALGRPVLGEVYARSPGWEKLKKFHATLYQPCGHPDFASHPVQRPNQARLSAIRACLTFAEERDLAIVGACTGHEVEFFRASEPEYILALEVNESRLALLHGQFVGLEDVAIYSSWDGVDFTGRTAICLSVLHHVASSTSAWIEKCHQLAKAPVIVVELPRSDESTWHEKFREESDGDPHANLVAILQDVGGFGPPEVIYRDKSYSNRETFILR